MLRQNAEAHGDSVLSSIRSTCHSIPVIAIGSRLFYSVEDYMKLRRCISAHLYTRNNVLWRTLQIDNYSNEWKGERIVYIKYTIFYKILKNILYTTKIYYLTELKKSPDRNIKI